MSAPLRASWITRRAPKTIPDGRNPFRVGQLLLLQHRKPRLGALAQQRPVILVLPRLRPGLLARLGAQAGKYKNDRALLRERAQAGLAVLQKRS